jgi:hypothetical protein
MKSKKRKSNVPPPTVDQARDEAKRTDASARTAKERVRSAKAGFKAAKKALKAVEKLAKKARKDAKRASRALEALLARQRTRRKKPTVRPSRPREDRKVSPPEAAAAETATPLPAELESTPS